MSAKQHCNYLHVVFILFAIISTLNLFIFSNLSAESKIPKVKLSVKSLDLSRTPTTDELMAAGQLGGQLYPTADIQIKDDSKIRNIKEKAENKRNKEINLSFGEAIEEWNKHEYKKAVKMFRKHAKDYPDSPWVDEALLHVGCDARYNGRYTEAEAMFDTIIQKNKNSSHYGAKMLRNKARQRLGVLKVIQSNFDESTRIFSELKKDSPDWRHRTYASHWIQKISTFKSDELALLNCGTEALAYLLKNDGRESEARDVMDILPSTSEGQSIKNLKTIAEKYRYDVKGLKLAAADLNSIPLPAIVQINAKNKGDRGHYWVLEEVNGNELKLFDSQSGRRFSQNTDEFMKEWDGNTIVFSDDESLPGILLTENEMEKIFGACCGAPTPNAPLGSTCPTSKGCPTWSVNMININFFMTDTPLWYNPPIGPGVKIALSYNSQSAIANNEPFGNKWQFNYGSYLVVDTGGTVIIFMPGGRRDVYNPDGSGGYTAPYKVYNTLTKIAENHFELRFQDDTVYVYNIPAGTGSQQPFLVEIRDRYNQTLTFGYNASVMLETITDAQNKVTTLVDTDSDGLVDRVDDPFGRSAYFEYDANRNLTKITDIGGYWTSLAYDADVYLTEKENTRGKWQFYTEPADGIPGQGDTYPPPGSIRMWVNYRITATNPLGDREEYMYYGGCGFGTCAGTSWHVSPENYIPYLDQQVINNNMSAPKTIYYPSRNNQYAEIKQITYPGNEYIEYTYDINGNILTRKDVLGTSSYTYNAQGNITSVTDPYQIVTQYNYAANGVDLLEIQNGLGTVAMTYNSTHDVTSIKDRLNNTIYFQYGSYGQLTQSTDPVGIVTDYTYDASNRLQSLSKDGSVVQSFTYDAIGRVDTTTDATGLVLDYDYNNLDKITKITYPDTKFQSYTYSNCCPLLTESITDRSGKSMTYEYDAMKRLTRAIGPDGSVIRYEYDRDGKVVKFIDANSTVTSYEYDIVQREIKKIYADGKFDLYQNNLAGLLWKKNNARGALTTYMYDKNHNLQSVTYDDTTPDITYTYDDYKRVTSRQDGMGTYSYTYDANNRLITVDGPWNNDIITFQYNALGDLKTLTPDGGKAITYNYDYDPEHPGSTGLGRLKDIQAGADTFSYHYNGVNPLVQSLVRPNGSVTEYQYNDPLKRLTGITNKTSADAIINQHVFTYSNIDVIDTETVNTGTALDTLTEGLKTYDYNNLNQVLSATPSETFTYDDDGNMTQGYTPDGYPMAMVYDAENRMISAEYTDSGSVVHRTEYFYNGEGFLAQIKKYEDSSPVSDTRFISVGLLPLQERDGSNSVTREYTWGINMGGGIGGLLNLNQGGQDYSYLYDGKGNVMSLIDSTETIAAFYRYDAFGVLKKEAGTLDQPYKFSTKQYDKLTGLSYYGYRHYSPVLGRWTARDPLGEAGGINLYGFVQNNPVNLVDPWGLFRSHWILRTFVPGQIAWDNALTALESKDYAGAGLHTAAMVGEQVLAVLTLGEGKAAQQCISKTQQLVDPLLYRTTVIPRKTLGADGASSEIIKRVNRVTGRTEEVIHQVIKDGKIIHRDIKYRR